MKIVSVIKAAMAAAFLISTSAIAAGPYRITGVGSSFDEAKLNAFRQAVEIYAGVVVVSNTEANNGKLTKEQILNYSSGYISNYKIIHNFQIDREHNVVVDVWVHDSKISQRILSTTDSHAINGHLVADQSQTFTNSKNSADTILNTVLERYPYNAYNIKMGKTNFGVDANRNTFANVEYEISWNDKWIKSLQEALTVLYMPEDNIPVYRVLFYNNPSAFLEHKKFHYFEIYERKVHYNMMVTFKNSYPQIKLSFLAGNRTVMSQCYNFAEERLINKNAVYNKVYAASFFNTNVVRGTVSMHMAQNNQIRQITEVKAEIVNNKQCN